MSVSATVSEVQTKPRATSRYWEIDTWRGIVVIMMIIYHLLFDLRMFGVLPDINLTSGFWKYFQRFIAVSFIMLAGVSLTLTYRRLQARGLRDGALFLPFLKRGAMLIGWGLVITIIMWLSGVGYIHYGVLSLIGTSTILAYPLLRFRWINLGLWALLFVLGGWVDQQYVSTLNFVWLGFHPERYYPLDYFPLIPWFGVVLLGVFLGNTLYTDSGRVFFLPNLSDRIPVRFLSFLGSHSLTIYLLHQPVLFALLYLLGVASM